MWNYMLLITKIDTFSCRFKQQKRCTQPHDTKHWLSQPKLGQFGSDPKNEVAGNGGQVESNMWISPARNSWDFRKNMD